MRARRNMHCLVMASKHISNICAIARQLPVTIEGLLVVVSVGSVLRLYSEDPRQAKCTSDEVSGVEQKEGRKEGSG